MSTTQEQDVSPAVLATPEDLAHQLQVSPHTIRKWYREGRLPGVRFSRKIVRFNPQKVLEALEK